MKDSNSTELNSQNMGFKETEREIQDKVNKVSLALAVITFLTWLLIGKLRPSLLNRVTLRFQMIISFIDILRHLSTFNVHVEDPGLCEIVGALVNFSDHIYVALNTLLAINAWLIFISRQRPKMTFYPLYAGASMAYIAILNYCYYSHGSFGRTTEGSCFYANKDGRTVVKFYMLYLMEVPGVLFCGYVVFLIMYKYKERMSRLRILRYNAYSRIEEETNTEFTNHIGKLYWRISMYPMSCFITLFPFFITGFLFDLGLTLPPWTDLVYRFCRRLPGTTNFFFMLYDPNFQLAVKELFKYIRDKLVKKPDVIELHELGHNQSAQPKGEPTFFDQLYSDGEWKIKFHDGFTMTLQDHIKYL